MASDWLIAKLSAVMESSGTSAGLEIQRSWVQVLFYSLRDVVLNSPEFNSSPTVRFKIASGFVCCQLGFFLTLLCLFSIFSCIHLLSLALKFPTGGSGQVRC